MSWCFGIVNNKLAEIYFDREKGKPKFYGHCYVKKYEYATKREIEWIEEDTAKIIIVYRNGKYYQKKNFKVYA